MIDPWASTSVDYDKLINQFGIEKISDIIGDIKDPQRLMKRGVVFGHREFKEINDLINKKEDFAVVTPIDLVSEKGCNVVSAYCRLGVICCKRYEL